MPLFTDLFLCLCASVSRWRKTVEAIAPVEFVELLAVHSEKGYHMLLYVFFRMKPI